MGVAGPSVLTGHDAAGVGADVAVFPSEAKRARAGVVVDAIQAGAGVLAGVAGTVIYVYFATRAFEALAASAHQGVTQIETMATFKMERNWLKSNTLLQIL